MNSFVADDMMTYDGDLENWQSFCLAYYEPILRALKLLRADPHQVEDLAHSFLLKAAERHFLENFRAFRDKEARHGRRARFRTYLYRSIQNHVYDGYRKRGAHGTLPLSTEVSQSFEVEPAAALDPDALYALDVLHQAIQALRRHCERTKKPELWEFFEETYLANEFRGRRGKSRAELLAAHPGLTPERLDNGLTTAKRAFRRFVDQVMPRGLRDDDAPGERFQEWMTILRQSNASQFNLLHLAYRVMPFISADHSNTGSTAMVVQSPAGDNPAPGYEEIPIAPDNDELSILLGFQLELPLTELLDPAELTRFIPRSSELWSLPSLGNRPPQRTGRAQARPGRKLCLLTLIDPDPAEAAALAESDLVGLLERLKLLAKQLGRRTDHTVPAVFAQLLYTLVNVLAQVRRGLDLHTIGAASLAANVRWFLNQPWLDDRVRPVLITGLNSLERVATAESDDVAT